MCVFLMGKAQLIEAKDTSILKNLFFFFKKSPNLKVRERKKKKKRKKQKDIDQEYVQLECHIESLVFLFLPMTKEEKIR